VLIHIGGKMGGGQCYVGFSGVSKRNAAKVEASEVLGNNLDAVVVAGLRYDRSQPCDAIDYCQRKKEAQASLLGGFLMIVSFFKEGWFSEEEELWLSGAEAIMYRIIGVKRKSVVGDDGCSKSNLAMIEREHVVLGHHYPFALQQRILEVLRFFERQIIGSRFERLDHRNNKKRSYSKGNWRRWANSPPQWTEAS